MTDVKTTDFLDDLMIEIEGDLRKDRAEHAKKIIRTKMTEVAKFRRVLDVAERELEMIKEDVRAGGDGSIFVARKDSTSY
jgi:hypothetical protein